MTKPATKSAQLAIRIDAAQLKLIDELVEAFEKSGVGLDVRPTRAAIMRTAMGLGLKQMKAGLPAPARRKGRN